MTKHSMICPLVQLVASQPDAPAIMTGELVWNYQELNKRVEREAHRLCHQGLREGEVIMACARNSPSLIVLILAALRAGIIVLPVNPAFPDAKLLAIADRVGVTALWSENGDRCPQWQGRRIGADCSEQEYFEANASELSCFHWNEQRICNLVLTSGSSGTPKAAAHNFRCHRANAEASAMAIPLKVGDKWLLSLPLFHIGGLAILFRCLLSGAAVVFPDNGKELSATLMRRPITHLSLVNTQLYRLLRQSVGPSGKPFDFRRSSVGLILVGGGYVSADLVNQCQQQGVTVLTSYGMTEMSSQICTGEPVFTGNGGVSSGRPLDSSEIHIADNGEIHVRGSSLFRGYWRQGALELPVDSEGWFATGDRGCWLDNGLSQDSGLLQVVGRVDFQFISGGENIQPETIEKAILALPGIQQAVVAPMANVEFGFRPVAFVKCAGDFSPEEWQRQLRQQLPRFMVPDLFLNWPQDYQPGLKINRRDFIEKAARLSTAQKYS